MIYLIIYQENIYTFSHFYRVSPCEVQNTKCQIYSFSYATLWNLMEALVGNKQIYNGNIHSLGLQISKKHCHFSYIKQSLGPDLICHINISLIY